MKKRTNKLVFLERLCVRIAAWMSQKTKILKRFSERNPEERELIPREGNGDALRDLYDVVIGPISNLIESDELIIVPDGPMFLVPYAALVDQHSRYLSESLRIRLVPTLTSLKVMAECPEEYHRKSGALLVGDPCVESVRLNREEESSSFQPPNKR